MNRKEALERTRNLFESTVNEAEYILIDLKESEGDIPAQFTYAEDLHAKAYELCRLAVRMQTLMGFINLEKE